MVGERDPNGAIAPGIVRSMGKLLYSPKFHKMNLGKRQPKIKL
jgi:hypothetical protein